MQITQQQEKYAEVYNMTNYTKGRGFEYWVKHLLEKHNYLVFRTAGSHSPADLIAFDHNCTYFIQCKTGKELNKARLTAQVTHEFNQLKLPYNPNLNYYLFIKEDRKEPEFLLLNAVFYRWSKVSEVWKNDMD